MYLFPLDQLLREGARRGAAPDPAALLPEQEHVLLFSQKVRECQSDCWAAAFLREEDQWAGADAV